MKRVHYFILILSLSLTIPLIAHGQTVPDISREEKLLAIDGVKNLYKGVKEALITQEGKKVRLTMVVIYETPEKLAKQLGDNLIRLVKTFSKDKTPGDELGEGIYDYSISVYYPNQELIGMGTKAAYERRVSW